MEQVKNLIFQNDNFTFYAVAFALVLTVAICLVQVIRTPPLLKRRFDRAVRRCGLHNAQNEYPVLISVKRDKDKPHGLILKVRNKGLSLPDFDRHYEWLKVTMGGIFRMEYGRNINYTLLYFLPQKYVRPALFTPDDSASGSIDVKHIINMLIVGATGTGKTVALQILLAKIARFQPDANIWLLDFKQFDFRNLSDKPRYYGYTDCQQGLEDYYAAFKQQQESGTAGAPQYLIIDEWGSFLLSLDKKTAEQAKARLAELLMLGRAYRFFPIVGIQRPDAAYFAGARDNFQCCLALGNLSREGRRMLFPDDFAESITQCSKREGHLYIDGVGIEKIRIAEVQSMDALDKAIQEAMSR